MLRGLNHLQKIYLLILGMMFTFILFSIKNDLFKIKADFGSINAVVLKEAVMSESLKRGSWTYSIIREMNNLKFTGQQFMSFFHNIKSIQTFKNIGSILSITLIFFITGIPFLTKNISIFMSPVIGMTFWVIIHAYLIFVGQTYEFNFFLMFGLIILVALFLLNGKKIIYILKNTSYDSKITIVYLYAIFLLIGHVGEMILPASYDHMTYSSYASMIKLGNNPFNIDFFKNGTMHINLPPSWTLLIAFLSDMFDMTVPRTQLLLSSSLFPFLGVGVFYLSNLLFQKASISLIVAILSLSLRSASLAIMDGDLPEIGEWAYVSVGLVLFFRNIKFGINYEKILSAILFAASFLIHIKLVVYTFAAIGIVCLIAIFSLKRDDAKKIINSYISVGVMTILIVLPYLLSIYVERRPIGPISMSLLEFFENVSFKHGPLVSLLLFLVFPYLKKEKNIIFLFVASQVGILVIYFNQWMLWDLLRPSWYEKGILSTTTFFGAWQYFKTYFFVLSDYSQISTGMNIVIPIAMVYVLLKLLKNFDKKITSIILLLIIFFESSIRPQTPGILMNPNEIAASNWIIQNTPKTSLILNVGKNESHSWNIAALNGRRNVFVRLVGHVENNNHYFDFEKLKKDLMINPKNVIEQARQRKITHVLISLNSKEKNKFLLKSPSKKVFSFNNNETEQEGVYLFEI